MSPLPVAVIVIPTYNEAENIKVLIPLLYDGVFPKISSWQMKILIIDGNSPDGTAKIVKNFMQTYSCLHLMEEKNRNGIGAAYMTGFSYAMKELAADAVIEFDADLQHPPEMIATLLNKLNEGFDYVIGSRTIQGGSQPKGRDSLRAWLTSFGGLLARYILFFPGKYFDIVTDPTSGLKVTRVKGCLDKLNLDPDHLFSKDFGYKVQLLSETLAASTRYTEIPLKFENRVTGKSKFEVGTIKDILVTCIKTRLAR